ncbi:trehalase [Hemicordylus capensis]|uniref:trehalase n=1 Tax=Hemicordylus capensis TaxID=884348 RepID=UPI0023043E00|nr:trehalase [Hemicordylus capensis]
MCQERALAGISERDGAEGQEKAVPPEGELDADQPGCSWQLVEQGQKKKMPAPAWWWLLGMGIALPGWWQQAAGEWRLPCDSQIYCSGELLKQVQLAQLFPDDKDFVDMPLQRSPEVVLAQFQRLVNATLGGALPRKQLEEFVKTHFSPPGQELENWEPPDWTGSPPLLERIANKELRSWARELNAKWKLLGRKMKPEVQSSPQRHSLLYVPHPLVVPGGRFIEYYYWDSFWVIEGLLLCNMTTTAKGMIQNFLYLVERIGHIPNGGRVYYTRRSQPPFLTLMVESYLRHTNHTDFLRANIHLLEAEYQFWQEKRAVNVTVGGTEYLLNRYNVQVGGPRPEAYSKDVELAAGLDEDARQELWAELKGAAESGWDFSSRWLLPGPPPLQATRRDTRTSAVVPVDLNAVLCRVEWLLASFYGALGNATKAAQFQAAHQRRVAALQAVLWSAEDGVWLDYNLLRRRRNRAFYPSNLAPLWTECGVTAGVVEKVLGYLQGSSALSYANGLPTSLARTGEQWDLPNAWAPLQDMVIAGLAKSSSLPAQELAFSLAQRWVRTNLAVYRRHHAMFEKYNVEGDGSPGSGGEYDVQEGFGWTNGVAFHLLDLYGDRLTSAGSPDPCTGAWAALLLLRMVWE